MGINVDNKNIKIDRMRYKDGSTMKMYPLWFFIDINFTNKRNSGFNILFSDFEFYPGKELNNIEFEILQRIYKKRDTGIPQEEFFINPGSKLGHIFVSMKRKKDYKIEEFLKYLKEYENTTMVLKFNYIVSNKFKKKPFECRLNCFFKYLADSIKKVIGNEY